MLKGIDYINAEAQILSSGEIKAGDKTLKTKYILLATGSRPLELPEIKFDGKKIISSDEILNLKEIPRSLLIIGGGVIGCEFASLFSALGTQVAIVEKMPQLLPGLDTEIAKKIEALFKKKGIKVKVDTDALSVNLEDYSLVLLCIGRTPHTDIKITVDDYLKTNINNIYAAGDCTGKTMLAHFAAYQGALAAENIASPEHPKKADNSHVPNCIFTDPEIASVGLSQEEAETRGFQIKINKFDFLGSSMARILDETDGFIKIISAAKTGEVLGASIIGPRATELISVLTLAISCCLKISQIKETIFAHPTLSEAIGEAVK